ncbi:RNA methyltransferase [Thermodesulfatator atlanticus]|uniref:RNA methyltransferase n=1 Tax=Thermodesulfatator atlanticus TaxID=501497 RepID=UPI0003B595AD|nr:RNA methyltransferase [Thermodesulfatator atlanticus]
MSKAYFYKCEACGLRFPALSELENCPACKKTLCLKATRALETDDYSSPAKKLFPPCVAVLDNIRSAWNVGSILRTGEAAGISHFYLCGITPTPAHPGVTKTALGAEKVVSWSHEPDAVKTLISLKERGFYLWSLETEGSALWDPQMEPPDKALALIVGNELCGVDPGVLDLCDLVLRLPMRGAKCSLNVAVAFGVLALWLSARRKD